MLLKDLIKELQSIYDKETSNGGLEVMGEPEIMIDVFEEVYGADRLFGYKGFDKEVRIDRSDDGVYLILNRFSK